MAKSKNLGTVFFICFMVIFSACSPKTKPVETQNTEQAHPGYELVTVRDFSHLDGCGYLLEKSGGDILIPKTLPDSLHKAGLKIFIQFKYADFMTTCMAGKSIVITEIKPSN